MTRTVVELLRHAVAASRDLWEHDDGRRPLDDAGRAQANRLAASLPSAGPPITAIASSPAARCLATVAPLADALDLVVVEEAGLEEVVEVPVSDAGDRWVEAAWKAGRALAAVDALVDTHPGERMVACSHGDVIPSLVALLAGREGLALPDVRCPPAGRFILDFSDGRCVSVVPAPPPRPKSPSYRQESR